MQRYSNLLHKILFLGLFATSACTDADFYYDIAKESAMMRVTFDSNICAPENMTVRVPYKILFVVDTSGSNKTGPNGTPGTDPAVPSRRHKAVKEAVRQHIDDGNVSFGIITFANQPTHQTFGFTTDRTILSDQNAFKKLDGGSGSTNYSDTLYMAFEFIVNDIILLDNKAETNRTHYIIEWISDGAPYGASATDLDSIISFVANMNDYLKTQVGEFKLNTFYLKNTSLDQQTATDLLTKMAEAGNGDFSMIETGEDIQINIQTVPMVISYVFNMAYAANLNTRFGTDHPIPDSDADGLTDEEEILKKTNPIDPDTDHDGIRDGIEADNAYSIFLDPLYDEVRCPTGDLDSDSDGLHDCEETILHTLPLNADSDGDYLIDSVEFLLGSSPLSADPSSDVDLDGITDNIEVRQHLSPHQANTPDDVIQWGYQYEVILIPNSDPESEQLCYQLKISNTSMYQTLGENNIPDGRNSFEIIVTYLPKDAIDPVRFSKAVVDGRFLLPDYREPANGIIELSDTDFTLLPSP